MNYAEHVRAVAAKIGQPPNLPTHPEIGYRANNALIGRAIRSSFPPTPPTRCSTRASWSR